MSKFSLPNFNVFYDDRNLTFAETVHPEIQHLMDPYWNQYPPMEPKWYAILGVIISILGSISLTGNFLVIYIFTTTKSLRTPSNLFVVNLAVSDFMMMFTMFPPVVFNGFYRTWIFGSLMCELYGLCGSLFGCVSIFSMILIARDRYNVIVKGIARKPLTNTWAVMQILFIWSTCGIWAVLPLFGWNRYVPEGNMTACSTDYLTVGWLSRSYIVLYTIWCYLVPLFSIIHSYYHIMKVVQEHEAAMRKQAKKMNIQSLRNDEDKAKSVEIKLAKVALCTIALWFVAWTPYTIINLAGIFDTLNLTPLATICGAIFAKANAVYDPIVYGLSHPKFKQPLRQKVSCLICAKSDTSQMDVKTQATAECTESTT